MPAPSPIRVGLIGYGFAGRTFHAPLIRATPGLELAAVASSRPDAVARDLPGVVVHREPEAMLADAALELIVVATPNDSHAAWAQAALAAGKAAVVEKPFALDLAEARRVIEAARSAGRLLAVFQNRRWDSDFLSVRQAIAGGAVGRVAQFESHFDRFRPQVRARWREAEGPGAGVWYDLGPHLADQALQLFGLPDAVSGDLAVLRDGGRADDWAHVVLHYPHLRVLLHASMLAVGGAPRFLVQGDGGSLVKRQADRQEAQLLAGMTPGAPGWGEDPDPLQLWDAEGVVRERPAVAGDQRGFYRAVAAALRGEAQTPTPPHEALAVMAVIEAAQRSSQSGRREPLGLTPEEAAPWRTRP